MRKDGALEAAQSLLGRYAIFRQRLLEQRASLLDRHRREHRARSKTGKIRRRQIDRHVPEAPEFRGVEGKRRRTVPFA
jgi:hypothetical protein